MADFSPLFFFRSLCFTFHLRAHNYLPLLAQELHLKYIPNKISPISANFQKVSLKTSFTLLSGRLTKYWVNNVWLSSDESWIVVVINPDSYGSILGNWVWRSNSHHGVNSTIIFRRFFVAFTKNISVHPSYGSPVTTCAIYAVCSLYHQSEGR